MDKPAMKIHTSRKNHRCDQCSRLIPVGVRYWRIFISLMNVDNDKQHTNCLDYEDQPIVTDKDVRKMNKQPKPPITEGDECGRNKRPSNSISR